MAENNEWTSNWKDLLKSPLTAHSCFGLIIFGLEKAVQIGFLCPCSEWSSFIVSSFFVIPALIAIMLMFYIQISIFDQPIRKACWYSLIPGVLWVILMFIDGRYLGCIKGPSSGKYEVLENPSFQRWCNPNSTEHSVIETQNWYSYSQAIAMWVAFGLAILYFLCLFYCCKKNTTETTTKDSAKAGKDSAEAEKDSAKAGKDSAEAAESEELIEVRPLDTQ